VQSAAAASFTLAPDSIASIYAAGLASTTAGAGSLPLPLSLGAISLTVEDANGVTRSAPLLYVSPTQINFVVPDGTAAGQATFTVNSGTATQSGTAVVANVAPALFSASGNGVGVAAATAIQTQAGDPSVQAPIPVFQCGASGCMATPISLGVDTPVYLTLYGTGIRNRSSLSNVSVTINGISVPVLFAGAQPDFAGLDQVNVPLTLNLMGSNLANVVLTVDGQTANIVLVDIQ